MGFLNVWKEKNYNNNNKTLSSLEIWFTPHFEGGLKWFRFLLMRLILYAFCRTSWLLKSDFKWDISFASLRHNTVLTSKPVTEMPEVSIRYSNGAQRFQQWLPHAIHTSLLRRRVFSEHLFGEWDEAPPFFVLFFSLVDSCLDTEIFSHLQVIVRTVCLKKKKIHKKSEHK